jgi:NAD(P)-dependent dehydrogenase (short-subunit alcohol dehydrogenase family)
MDLNNKVAIVTGGAKGIGLASAECMLRQGAEVMIVDWSGDAASAAVKSLTALQRGRVHRRRYFQSGGCGKGNPSHC